MWVDKEVESKRLLRETAETVRAVRERSGLSIEYVARATCVHEAVLERFEAFEGTISTTQLADIAKVLGLDFTALLRGIALEAEDAEQGVDRDDVGWTTVAAAILSGMIARVPPTESVEKAIDHDLVIKIADDFVRHRRKLDADAFRAQEEKQKKLMKAVAASFVDDEDPS